MTTVMIRPEIRPGPMAPSVPPILASTTTAPAAKKTSENVPMNSQQ